MQWKTPEKVVRSQAKPKGTRQLFELGIELKLNQKFCLSWYCDINIGIDQTWKKYQHRKFDHQTQTETSVAAPYPWRHLHLLSKI